MNTFKINAFAIALGLAFSAGAIAQSMSRVDYKAGKDKIAAEYKSARVDCRSLSGNPNDICVAVAKGKEKIAMADLDASYKPSDKTRYQASVAKADADYAVARERCDDKTGNAKDICLKEAKSVQTTAKADAKAQLKTSDAKATAREKSADARDDAHKQVAAAKKDASSEKRDAEYAVAKEKCDTFAGAAKDRCLEQARAHFGKT